MSTAQGTKNAQFELRGINHLALVCSDMARTIDFYSNVLGMPLVGNIVLPDGKGNHFFFDIGKGDLLAFFWLPDAPKAAPGVASPRKNLGDSNDPNDFVTAHASMNHVAFDVPAEKIDEYRQRLLAKGIPNTIINHDLSPRQYSETVNENTTGRSIYFMDPDGIVLEFAAWLRPLEEVPELPERDLRELELRQSALIADLRQVDFLKGLTDEELKMLRPNIRFRQFGTGKVLMHQGEVGEYFHILRQGTVEVVAQAANGGSIHIRDLKAPDFFGEIALLTREPRRASVVARSHVEVLELNRDAFTHLFRERPESLNDVSEVVARRISGTRERVEAAAAQGDRRGENWLVTEMRAIFGV
jgi:CRP-like cAMP-binding protein/catechol 2,3-dioxygenase-like lactoylglutathione lyase family enzyme